jgi:hypothetical protein
MRPGIAFYIVTSCLAAAASSGACRTSEIDPPTFTRDALLDPTSCKGCHDEHYAQWSASMHAYAADDPVFLAMNRRGQRETNGALGSFCVNCHAPMALRSGATRDGLNLADVPQKLKGVTCFFCHTVDGIEGSHNNQLHLSSDPIMLGELSDPVTNTAHKSGYSTLHDRNKADSSKLCGVCHDVVTEAGAQVERTYSEWQFSAFAHENGATCGQCHMEQSATPKPIANTPGVGARRIHSHEFPAVDTALTSGFPEIDAQKKKVQALLNTTLQTALCVTRNRGVRVLVDNVAAGHSWPSGVAHDRRVWTEVIAYKEGRTLYATGVVGDGAKVMSDSDPDLWLLRDCIFDVSSKPISMFWGAASYASNQLPAQATFDPKDMRFYQNHIVQRFPRSTVTALPEEPDRVTLRVRLQPIGADVLEDLANSGDLDPSFAKAMPTFDMGETPLLEWTPTAATDTYYEDRMPVTCVTASNFNIQADKIPARDSHAICVKPPDQGARDAGPITDGSAVISCGSDPRADAYVENLSKPGRAGVFGFTLVRGDITPPGRGTNAWVVRVTDTAGAPISNATLVAKPLMPDHGHGTSIVPRATPTSRGDGTYDVAPLYLFMPGLWQVTVTATSGTKTDTAVFSFCIEG